MGNRLNRRRRKRQKGGIWLTKLMKYMNPKLKAGYAAYKAYESFRKLQKGKGRQQKGGVMMRYGPPPIWGKWNDKRLVLN